MSFIGVEVEQETSAPPPKKNPGSAPVVWYVLPCGYLTFPIYGNTMLRYEQQTSITLFCTLKSDFMDVKRFEF